MEYLITYGLWILALLGCGWLANIAHERGW